MDSSATEEVIERQILGFITEGRRGVTALEVGDKFNWSVGVAIELLQVCPPRKLGVLEVGIDV